MFNLNKGQQHIYYKMVNSKRDRYALKYNILFRDALEQQTNEAIKTIEANGTDLSLFQVPTEAYLKPMRKAMITTYNEVGIRFYNDTRSAAKSIKGYYQTKNNESIWLEYVLGWIGSSGGTKITNISETTLNLVRRVLNRSVQDGLSIPNTVKLMKESMLDFNKFRARMIARTEVIGASNLGNYEGAISTGLPMSKTWLSKIDSRTRGASGKSSYDHVSIDGTEINKEDDFIVSGEPMKRPHDERASAGNVINCRCVLTWKVL